MRRFVLLFTLLIVVLGSNAMGFSWTPGYYNHGDSPFDFNNNYAPIDYPHGVGYLPSPGTLGEGGEAYDLEGFFVASDNDYLYIALTNSFGQSVTSSSWGTTFEQGDIFFGWGMDPNAFALDVSSGELVDVKYWDWIPNVDGSYYGNADIRNRVGAFQIDEGTVLGSANQTLTLWNGLETNPMTPDPTNGNTHVFEWKIDRSLLAWDGLEDIRFHTTLGCGNDLIEYNYAPIPEPGTIILLGLGLFGAGMFVRRK